MFALSKGKLRPNQIHIGNQAVLLLSSLAETTLYTAIEESCGLSPNIQTTTKEIIRIMQEQGLNYSIGGKIAVKQDMTSFFKVSTGVLNNYLRKHNIIPINLSHSTILEAGFKASRMLEFGQNKDKQREH
ncbi:MAG: hypothetical protein QM487_13325 [Candidatus Marithrix sp.]